MGALQGTLTYKLYFVEGEIPGDMKATFLAGIKHRAFFPLTPEDEDEERIGWVPIDRPLDTEFYNDNVFFNDFVNLSLRHDKFVIPSQLLKAHAAQAERAYMAQNDKKKLSKFERDDIKDMTRRQLKEQSLPRMKTIDMSWDLGQMRVRFWNQSNKMCEIFQGYFEDTFGLRLIPANPYTHATQMGLGSDAVARLESVEPSQFVEGIPGVDF